MMMFKGTIYVSFMAILFIALFIAFTVVGYADTPQQFGKWKKGETLVENGDFELGTEQWTLEDGACCNRGGLYQWEVDSKDKHGGKKSLKVIGVKATGTDWHAKVRHDSTSMRAGKPFTLVFWAKSEKPRLVSVSVQMQHDPWTFYQGGSITLEGPAWKEYSLTFNSNADVDRDMWVGLAIAQSDVSFWLDDFRFFEGDLKDEIGAKPAPESIEAVGKLSTTWGKIKGRY